MLQPRYFLCQETLCRASSDTSSEARENWKHTQNWIAYEIGIASERLKDVWVLCDDVEINFPVPCLNNYALRRDFDPNKKISYDYSRIGNIACIDSCPPQARLLGIRKQPSIVPMLIAELRTIFIHRYVKETSSNASPAYNLLNWTRTGTFILLDLLCV